MLTRDIFYYESYSEITDVTYKQFFVLLKINHLFKFRASKSQEMALKEILKIKRLVLFIIAFGVRWIIIKTTIIVLQAYATLSFRVS